MSQLIKTRILNVFRGDSIEIPILATLIDGAIYRAQLRHSTESTEYFTLVISDNKMLISAEQSVNLTQGTWYADLDENNAGVITTLQRSEVVIKNDITRTYGEPAPEWGTEQSVEVAEIISKDFYVRNTDNSLRRVNVDVYYRFTQNIPSDTWEIPHTLNKRPSVFITDSAGSVVEGEVKHIDQNNVIVKFSAAFSGYAELN